jgi:Fe-S-cluster-containing hydrogenase component 2
MVDGVWVDVAACTGCGACIDVCPAGAIALVDGGARIDETACERCGACIEVCPSGALKPVIAINTTGERTVVPGPTAKAPAAQVPAVKTESSDQGLMTEVGAAVVAAGTGLVLHAMRNLMRFGLDLLRGSDSLSPEPRSRDASAAVTRQGPGSGGRRSRRRRHGRGH